MNGPVYSSGEEIGHSVAHGIGVVLSIAALTVMVAFAAITGDPWRIVSVAVFGATLVLLYTASTVYHAVPLRGAKRVLRALDHSAIYLLIAGTYTPFALVSLRGPVGWTMFVVVWLLALLGVVLTAVALHRVRVLAMLLYVGMGWLIVAAAKPLLAVLGGGSLALLVAGGLAYTVGLAAYAMKRRWAHFVWHLFVLAGSVCHILAVLFGVVLS